MTCVLAALASVHPWWPGGCWWWWWHCKLCIYVCCVLCVVHWYVPCPCQVWIFWCHWASHIPTEYFCVPRVYYVDELARHEGIEWIFQLALFSWPFCPLTCFACTAFLLSGGPCCAANYSTGVPGTSLLMPLTIYGQNSAWYVIWLTFSLPCNLFSLSLPLFSIGLGITRVIKR